MVKKTKNTEMPEPKQPIREWLMEHQPDALETLEWAQNERRDRRSQYGEGYNSSDLKRIEEETWITIRSTPGWTAQTMLAYVEPVLFVRTPYWRDRGGRKGDQQDAS